MLEDLSRGRYHLEYDAGGDVYSNTGQSVVEASQIKAYRVAADMVYNPLETELLRLAKEAGLQTVSGL